TKEVCLEHLERGAVYEASQEPGANNLNYRQLHGELDVLQRVLKLVENALHGLAEKMGKDGLTRPGAWLFEFLGGLNINEQTLPVLNTTIDMAYDCLMAAQLEAGQTVSRDKGGIQALQHLQSCLNLAFSTTDPISNLPGAPPAHKARKGGQGAAGRGQAAGSRQQGGQGAQGAGEAGGYRVHVHLQRSWGADKLAAPTLSFWCFTPGMAFRMLKALRLRSILLTSGTLSPLDSFAHELQLSFDIRLENPHIIHPSQVWVGVMGSGPSGYPLCSNYQSREDVKYKDDLGNAVVNFARLVPDGLLVFFPSYGVLNSCLEHWKVPGAGGGLSAWERIVRHKAPVVEPRDSGVFQQLLASLTATGSLSGCAMLSNAGAQAIDEFKNKLDDPATTGAVFFAVCRGKVSEGLDFSDRAGRGVIITGIPFAMKTDPKVRLKREVLDEALRGPAATRGPGLTGEAWYVQQAMRAVNQAMGRVIRHRWDYGAVLLVDK
ncbi:hypothetical protein QJQ45_021052, partial [Haematococcus lacustris]